MSVWKRLLGQPGSARATAPREQEAKASAALDDAPASTSPDEGSSADTLIVAGHGLEDAGNFEGALALYLRAAGTLPPSPRAYLNVANALRALNRRDEALEALKTAIGCAPDYAPAHFNIGNLLKECDDIPGAEQALLTALRLQPAMVEAMVVLADLYEVDGRPDEAEAYYERALTFAPRAAATLLNYGMFESRRHNLDKALDLFGRARANEPGFADIYSMFVFSLNFRTDVDVETIARLHRHAGERIAETAGEPFTQWSNSVSVDRPLRVGYVSGDFLMHPVSVFLRPVLEAHDREQFEVFCYSNYGKPNPVADFLRERSDHWRDIAGHSDADVADGVRADQIDVLVDLSGHTARHRLPVFARHPAPVQVTWLGYLNTTGLPAMDYRLCDWHTDPPGVEAANSERLERLPHSQWCYIPWHNADVVETPHHERPDVVVFGSFNQDRKVSDACLSAWAQILLRAPGAELIVLDFPDPAMRKLFFQRAARLGIDPARVVVRGRESIAGYFASIGNVDIALDTFPYGGATTTLDTLWMSVPIVALRGDRGISRGSYSIMKSLGADELIAYTTDEYIDINVRLARDPAWRQRLRHTLRNRLLDSSLVDAKGFTRALEMRYRQMWQAWCERQSSN